MKLNNWLVAIGEVRAVLKSSLSGRPRRRRGQRGATSTESLQPRALLSVNSVLNPATKQWNDLPPRPWPETPEAFVQDPSDPGSGTLVTTDDPERLADPCTD